MTMNFHLADAIDVGELESGQRVEFELTMDNGGTVTAIAPLP